jgi:hypothetical protein
VAVVANPDVVDGLTDEQRSWLGAAADAAAAESSRLVDTDGESLTESCESGARVSQASQAQLTALEAAFAPVYAELGQDPETRSYLDEIRALKERSTPAPALATPEDCTGEPPAVETASSGTAPEYLNGVYRYTITREDAAAAGQGDDPEYPLTNTWWLEDGSWRASGGSAGNFWVDGDRLSIEWTAPFDSVFVFSFTRDDDGTLTLEPAQPMDPGDALLIAGKPWIKIG